MMGYVTMAYKKDVMLATVAYARRCSIREAAREFHISRNTVRKWYRKRYPLLEQPQGEPEPENISDETGGE